MVIVDGAQGGKDAAAWSDETTGAAVWNLAETRLRAAGAAPAQVQVVWLKQARINPSRYGDYPKHAEELRAPLVLWGPYLWSDGLTPRQSDGLVWKREDLGGNGTHPSAGPGREKVAVLLLNFLKSDPYAKPWFLRLPGPPPK